MGTVKIPGRLTTAEKTTPIRHMPVMTIHHP
jgi:hypothetical protein